MKKTTIFFAALLGLLCFSLLSHGTALAKEQTNCPVMGGKIDKKIYADHDGKRVYFCCAGCIEPFKKEPAKHIKKLEDGGVVLTKVPAVKEKQEKKKKVDDHAGHNH
jgi:YHS domain-containing protein